MSRMDWVPCEKYGDIQTAVSNAQTDFPLMNPTEYGDPDVEGRFEESANRYFVHRIVGRVTMNRLETLTGSRLITEVIWPGIIDDPSAGSIASPGFIARPSGANARLWFLRQKRVETLVQFFDLDQESQPWYTYIDIQPKQVIDDGQIIIFSVDNAATPSGDCQVQFFLRMLLTPIS